MYVFCSILASNAVGQCLEITTAERLKVCSSEAALLSATTKGTVLFSEWTPTNELTNPLSLTTPITEPFDTTYTLTVKGFSEMNNLLINGDFNEGNMGFTSQYEYKSTKPGGYIIGTIGTELFKEAKACEDHSTPEAGGNMLMVRVSESENVEIYCQEIEVSSNQEFHFQGFATGLVLNSPPVIELKINEEVISIGTLGSFACSWQKIKGDWYSGNANTAKICLFVSQEDIGAGTDFVIDDVGFYEICEVKKTVEIETIPFSIEIEEQVSFACGDSLRLQANLIPSNTIFESEWTTENGQIVKGERSLSPTIDASGEYELTVLTTVDEQICQAKKTVTASYSNTDPLEIYKSNNLNCKQNEVILEAIDSINQTNYQYEWSSLDGYFLPVTNQPIIKIDQPGIYQLERTKIAGNCKVKAEVEVSDNTLQDFTVNLQLPNCEQPMGTIEFDSILGGQAPFSYSIDNGKTFFQGKTFPNLEGGTYLLMVEDLNKCNLKKSISISSYPNISLLLPNSANIFSNERFQIPLQINTPDSLLKEIVWSPGFGLSCVNCVQPTVLSKNSQSYQVVVTGQNDCSTQASIQVNIKESSDVYLPTAFSPNKDGQNDVFQIQANLERVKKIIRFHVYDRYGNMVFNQTEFFPNSIGNSWNGEYQGQLLPVGVYVYWVELELANGEFTRISGTVGLVR